jgi:endonuclease/exonuclease/phosphatase family metal-dependent hydrolase
MNPVVIKAATWNIGGGILGESHQRDAHPSLDYYISVLDKYSPDIVCLQEAHEYPGGKEGQPEHLANRCEYPYYVSFPVSPSHMISHASLALGILSRFPIKASQYKQFPNPGLSGTGPKGDHWEIADKGYILSAIDLGGRTVGVINAHCFPLYYFGASPTEPRFANIWEMLIEDMESLRRQSPAFVAIDLNHEPAQDLLSAALGPGKYDLAFDNTPTTPQGIQQDYILYSHDAHLITTYVTPTESDHSYCQAAIAL